MKYERSTGDPLFATGPRNESILKEMAFSENAPMRSMLASGESPVLRSLQDWDLEMLDAVVATAPELDILEAAALGQVERIAELLMEEPERAFVKSGDGYTSLHLASFYGQYEVVNELVNCGVAVSARASNGVTPLHEAASTGQLEIVRLLLAHGAEVDAIDRFGSTALHVAASNGHLNVAEALLHAGATFCLNLDHQSPRDLALAHQHDEILQLWPSLTVGEIPRSV